MPKVSVIVATYNQEDSIGRTLDSILAQQADFDVEIVVGEDASTDRTRTVCEEYATRFPQIKLMPQAPNKGLTRNYFDCLEACTGEYIADCAGDDRWCDPLKLAAQARFLDEHPEVALVHTAWQAVNTAGDPVGAPVVHPFAPVTDGREMVLKLLRHDKPQPVHLCTAMYRRDAVMEEYSRHRDMFRSQCAEDLTISCMLLRSRQAGYLPQVTLEYTVGGSNAISNPASLLRAAEFYRRSLEMTVTLAGLTGTSQSMLRSALKVMTHYALSMAVAARSRAAVDAFRRTRRELDLPLGWKSRVKLAIANYICR